MIFDRNENKPVIALLGAGSMGTAIVRRIAAGKKILLGDISEKNLEKVSHDFRYSGYDVETMIVNALEKDSVEAFAQKAASLGPVMTFIDTALDRGYTVCWGGDVSGNGFTRLGIAQEDTLPTQQLRQQRFDSWKSTYDHVMLIYGKARDQHGLEYYMVKNSWGEAGPYKGIWYMRRNYIALNTTYIFLNRRALPTSQVSSCHQ
jgi:aminopeptidase C